MPAVPVVWAGFFLINFNVAVMIPLLPFMQRDMHLGSVEGGAILAAFPVAALVSNLVLGPFIDRYGRKRFIVAGGCGAAATLLATAFADSAATVIALRAATGLFMPMIGASVFAAISDYYPVEARVRITGYVTSAAPVAMLLSLSLGVVSGGLLDWRVALAGLAAFAALLAAAATLLPPTPPALRATLPIGPSTYRARLLSFSGGPDIRLVLLAYLAYSAAVFLFLGLYPAWILAVGDATPATLGAMLFVGGLGGLAGALLSGRLAARFRHPLTLCAVAAAATAGAALLAPLAGEGLVGQAAIYGGFAFGRDLMLALMLGGAMLLVAPTERASLNAVMNALFQLGAAAGGMASASLYAADSSYTATAAATALLLAAAALMLRRIAARRGGAAG
ncbi:MAG: MFS transporter [Alphaproteobacteria bacterium]